MTKPTFEDVKKLIEDVREADEKYFEEKQKFDVLKAQYILENDWEKVLKKSRPTVGEKEAYIKISTQEFEKKVKGLKRELEYLENLLEISKNAMDK